MKIFCGDRITSLLLQTNIYSILYFKTLKPVIIQ